MPSVEFLFPFFVTAVLLSITPGPGMLYIAAQTVARGQRAGWYSALGTHLASYAHITATAFGLSFFLSAIPMAYFALKVVGALYLFWLGFRFMTTDEMPVNVQRSSTSSSHIKALRESLVVELTNPKSAIFFIAFLPQFTDEAAASPFWLQILFLGFVANLIFSLAEVGCVIFADKVSSVVRKSRSAGRWLRRAAGMVFLGLGAHLLSSQR